MVARRAGDGPSRPDRARRVTLSDVASEAGVSVATASRVLNGGGRPVRDTYQRRVRQAAARLGYRPDLTAQAMTRGWNRTAALVVGDVRDPSSAELARGAVDAAGRAGLVVTIGTGGRTAEDQVQILRGLRGRRPAVVVLANPRLETTGARDELLDELAGLRSAGVRVVLVGARLDGYPAVLFDEARGTEELSEALAGLGYRSALVLGGSPATLVARAHRLGHELEAAGVQVSVLDSEAATRDAAYTAVAALPITALAVYDVIVALDDLAAVGVCAALTEHGVQVGPEIAVTGFHDLPTASDVRPALTSVRYPFLEAGRRAVDLAMSDDPQSDDVLPVHVVLRASTPPR